MPKATSAYRNLQTVLFWVISAATVVACVMILQRYLNRLPIELELWAITVLLSFAAGVLYVRTDLGAAPADGHPGDDDDRITRLYRDTPAMLLTLDADERLERVSNAWLKNFGYREAEVRDRPLADFIIEESLDDHADLQVGGPAGHGSDETHCLMCCRDGREVEVSLNRAARTGPGGEVLGYQVVVTDLTTFREIEKNIEQLAYFDSLTGLPNRDLLYDRLLQSMALARRDERQVGIFFFDLDRFKLINDTQGHAVGDLVLRSVAQRLKKFIREGDTFARLGGDEFVILQADPVHDPNFATLARRILDALREPFRLNNREFYTTASIGVAVYPIDGDDPQTLLKSADTAMYVAKSSGRDNFQFFSGEMNAIAVAKTRMETRLRKALQNDDLQQHYQPQVDLATGQITGVEALLRWYDESGLQIAPEEVVSVAEECGLVYQLGEWSLLQACSQARAWRDAGLPPIRMSVNLSGHHIRQADFIDHIEEILEKTGLPPDALEIELNETSVMGHVNDVIMALTDLKVRGITLAIDDFGTGSSSLLFLKHFPIHRIKIAQEFIEDLSANRDHAAITEAIIAMAHTLNLKVSAVGVEDEAQLAFLRQHRCAEAQGRLLGPVGSADQVGRILRDALGEDDGKTAAPPGQGTESGPRLVR